MVSWLVVVGRWAAPVGSGGQQTARGRGRGHCRHGILAGIVAVALMTGAGRAGEPYDEMPSESDIASAAAEVLRDANVSHQPLDSALSSRFLAGYLDMLDSRHLVFLQSDVDEFAWFRPQLAQMTAAAAETWPAHLVFARYMRRLEEKVSFQTNYLRTAHFEFTGSDSWQPERRDLPRPRDRNEARALWRQEVRADYLAEKLAGTPAAEIAPRLARRYGRRLEVIRQLKFDEVLELYLDALAQAFDPHSDYFGHEEAQEFNNVLNLSLAGIGGSLEAKGGYWVVGSLVPGGPAARCGRLHPGDRIVAVGQGDAEPEEVTELPSWQVVGLIRGPEGSTVRLTIIPAGQSSATRQIVALVRENVKLTDEVARASVIDLPQGHSAVCRVGVISLPLFYEGQDGASAGAAADVARLIQRLKQECVSGLVLDLRRNPGGSLNEAIRIAGLFLPPGPVLQMRDATGHVEVESSPGTNALYDGPLVVLTSRHSASASEIVAGTLQDYGRAVIVGDSATFGKGTVQTLVSLKTLFLHPLFGTVKVTVAKFYRPSGASTQLKGVVPDIVLPSESDLPGLGEARLENALPWDTVAPTEYRKFDLVSPVLPTLRAKSSARVAADPWFQLVRSELAAWAGQIGQPISLNESVRRGDNQRAERLQRELRQALLADSARRRENSTLALAATPEADPAADNPDDIELRETENILADYIQSLQLIPNETSGVSFRPCQTSSPKLPSAARPLSKTVSTGPVKPGRRPT